MRYIFFLILIYSSSIYAQADKLDKLPVDSLTRKIKYESIVKIDSSKSQGLYNRLYKWASETYNLQDVPEGEIYGTGKKIISVNPGVFREPANIYFNIDITINGSTCKMVITDFFLEQNSIGGLVTAESLYLKSPHSGLQQQFFYHLNELALDVMASFEKVTEASLKQNSPGPPKKQNLSEISKKPDNAFSLKTQMEVANELKKASNHYYTGLGLSVLGGGRVYSYSIRGVNSAATPLLVIGGSVSLIGLIYTLESISHIGKAGRIMARENFSLVGNQGFGISYNF
jgi:hypothetical protein